jgi:hypothetical protein
MHCAAEPTWRHGVCALCSGRCWNKKRRLTISLSLCKALHVPRDSRDGTNNAARYVMRIGAKVARVPSNGQGKRTRQRSGRWLHFAARCWADLAARRSTTTRGARGVLLCAHVAGRHAPPRQPDSGLLVVSEVRWIVLFSYSGLP